MTQDQHSRLMAAHAEQLAYNARPGIHTGRM
jgi:hypothetical protein